MKTYDIHWVRRLRGIEQVQATSKQQAEQLFYEMADRGEVVDPDAELGEIVIETNGIEIVRDLEDDEDDEE